MGPAGSEVAWTPRRDIRRNPGMATRRIPKTGSPGESPPKRGLPEKLYRMAEVMDHTGMSRQTLHYYATLGLIREKKRSGAGYRFFAPTVFRDLERVKRLQGKGMTLREIREKLESQS